MCTPGLVTSFTMVSASVAPGGVDEDVISTTPDTAFRWDSILPPINPDGPSVFKRGSTVPVKFRVCDAAGQSVGTPGLVTSFTMVFPSVARGGGDEEVLCV